MRSDIAAVRRAMDACRHPAMLYVDCVSSLASMDFRQDEWGVDLAVSGSQKGFMLATGIAIIGASEKALAAMETWRDARAASSTFATWARRMRTTDSPTPLPLQIMHGLRESLTMLFEEGLDNVFARHRRIAEGVRRAVAAWGLELCAKSPELYSDTVSAVRVTEGLDAGALTDHAYDTYGVSFGTGLGPLAGKVFRIGHLGSMTDVMALSGLATMEMAMADLDYPVELGSGVRAAQEYYRRTAGVPAPQAG